MEKVEVGTLDEHELFEYRGIIYEVLYKTDYCVRCQYPNDKYRYRDKWKYLYTEFSLWQVPMGMDILLPVLTVCMILWNKL